MAKHVRPYLLLALVAAVLLPALHSNAQTNSSAGPCSALIAQRNATFDRMRENEKTVAALSRHISAYEAQVKLISGLSEPATEAIDRKRLAGYKKALAETQAKLRQDQADVKKLDAEIKECRAGKKPKSVNMSGQWAGVWRAENTQQFYHLSGGTTSLTYTYQDSDTLPGHSLSGSGKCTVNGNTASCRWEERSVSVDPNTNQSYEEDFTGNETLTLGPDLKIGATNYDTIRQHRVITSRSGDLNHDLPLKAGWTIEGRLLRKK